MIIKVQRPLQSNEADPKLLLYNCRRTVLQRFPYTQEWRDVFAKYHNAEKLFFKGILNDKGELEIKGYPLNYDPGW